MYLVEWMTDADAEHRYVQYFTRGTAIEQLRDATQFARSLDIDPERGHVTVREYDDSRPAVHPELDS